jgi:hypothetical protein
MAFDFPSSPAVDDVFSTATATYRWNGYAWSRIATATVVTVDYVDVAGDTMQGPLLLAGLPTQPNEAASKAYVDSVMPTGGTVGQALTINTTSTPQWGAPIDGANF